MYDSFGFPIMRGIISSRIAFILGNGFDLQLGMKTRYSDVYKTYIRLPSESLTIERFKDHLKREKKSEKWSDFEMGMAEYSEVLSSESELIECVRDFKKHMSNYLKKEESEFFKRAQKKSMDDIVNEFDRSTECFFEEFPNNIKSVCSNFISRFPCLPGGYQIPNAPVVEKRVITFNYTSVIDALLNSRAHVHSQTPDRAIHIHGTLGKDDLALGTDTIDQIRGCQKYRLTTKGKRAFVKPFFNEQCDNERVANAKEMIKNSSFICTYGFSFGGSDRLWVKLIEGWLREDSNHRLVVFQKYGENQKRYDEAGMDERMDAEDDERVKFCERVGFDRSTIEQIYLPVKHQLFNFNFRK